MIKKERKWQAIVLELKTNLQQSRLNIWTGCSALTY